jgi:hypothetical protein
MIYFVIGTSILVAWALLRLLGGEREYRFRVLQNELEARRVKEAEDRKRVQVV